VGFVVELVGLEEAFLPESLFFFAASLGSFKAAVLKQ
jgi:hypothetical protein